MNIPNQNSNKQGPELSDIIQPYLKNWFWFVVSVAICLFLAVVNIRYTTPKYKATAKIQIIDEDNSTSALDLFSDLSVFKGASNNVEDEIEIIASRSNLIEVVRRLNLNVSVYNQGNIISTELYRKSPVNLNFIGQDSTFNQSELAFYLDLDGDTSFSYREIDTDNEEVKRVDYGKNLMTSIGSIVITPNEAYFDQYKGDRLRVRIAPVMDVAERYRNEIRVIQGEEFSNILTLSLVDEQREKARDILDELVSIYNQNAIEDKQTIADRTARFINDRIADISSSLTSVDQTAEEFKAQRGVTDLASEANVNLNVGAANRQELADAETQLNIAAAMKDIVDNQDRFDIIPPNVGLNDPTIAATTQRYNQLIQERNRLLKSSNEKNPVIVNLDGELNALKRTMQSSLNNTVNNLTLQLNNLSGQRAIIRSKIYSAPKTERALRDITRKQQTTEQLYLYLLQKREEAQIAVASPAPKSKLIDRAYYGKFPVAPKKPAIFLAFFLMGVGLPFVVIYTKELLDNKIHNMYQVERLTGDIPVLGELPRIGRRQSKIVMHDDRSVLAEALRIVRTNLDYLIRTRKPGETHKNNVVYITSSVSGEGKTFLSVNLSMILSATDKSVLLIGADVRNPKFKKFFQNKSIGVTDIRNSRVNAGLTEFLVDPKLQPEDIVNRVTLFNNPIDVIYSGRIPPNPSELLMSDRLGELLEKSSQKYDYVIVDTSPMMLVSDTLLIGHFANHTIYVTRAETTETKMLQFPMKLRADGKIKGLAFVVNDVKTSNLGYGGKYGYGYGKKKKSWFGR